MERIESRKGRSSRVMPAERRRKARAEERAIKRRRGFTLSFPVMSSRRPPKKAGITVRNKRVYSLEKKTSFLRLANNTQKKRAQISPIPPSLGAGNW